MAKFLAPQGPKPFACSGAACELTCCQMWTIHIDAEAVKWMHAHTHYSSVATLVKNLEPASEEGTELKKGTMLLQLDENGYCPVLKDGLCTMQLEAGFAVLPRICRMYPRIRYQINGKMELAYHLSCPEVARLFLPIKDGISFTEIDDPYFDGQIDGTFQTKGKMGIPFPARHMETVRSLFLSILRDRRFSIEIRLLYIGFWLSKLSACASVFDVPKINDTYAKMFLRDDIASLFADFSASEDKLLTLISGLMQINTSAASKEHKNLEDAISFLADDSDLGVTTESYRKNRQKYYDIAPYEHVLENYLVMYSWAYIVPFSCDMDVWKSYMLLITVFLHARFMVLATAAKENGLTEDSMINTLFIHYRERNQSITLQKLILEWMNDNDYNTMATLAPSILA